MQADKSFSSNTPTLQTLSRQDFWQRHISQWRVSGLSKMAYCKQYALVYHQMVYWSSKMIQSDETTLPSSDDFVSVTVTPSLNDTTGLRIRLPNGITIEGIDEHSVGWMGRLVQQL